MSDEAASNVEVEFDVDPSFVLELDADWLAYLEQAESPAMIAGIDPNLRYLFDDDADGGTALA
jgi:hypothetical protein